MRIGVMTNLNDMIGWPPGQSKNQPTVDVREWVEQRNRALLACGIDEAWSMMPEASELEMVAASRTPIGMVTAAPGLQLRYGVDTTIPRPGQPAKPTDHNWLHRIWYRAAGYRANGLKRGILCGDDLRGFDEGHVEHMCRIADAAPDTDVIVSIADSQLANVSQQTPPLVLRKTLPANLLVMFQVYRLYRKPTDVQPSLWSVLDDMERAFGLVKGFRDRTGMRVGVCLSSFGATWNPRPSVPAHMYPLPRLTRESLLLARECAFERVAFFTAVHNLNADAAGSRWMGLFDGHALLQTCDWSASLAGDGSGWTLGAEIAETRRVLKALEAA